jgi:hypothetical protein
MLKSGIKVLTFAVLCLAGCNVVVGPGQGPSQPWPEDETTLAEIDAAADLMFDDAKSKAFSDIAARPYLSAAAQVRLVEKAMDSLMFDSGKQQVMLALIKNSWFVREGKTAVLEHLDEFMFDSAKQTILQALNRRGNIPSEAEMRAIHEKRNLLPQKSPVETEVKVEVESSYGAGL